MSTTRVWTPATSAPTAPDAEPSIALRWATLLTAAAGLTTLASARVVPVSAAGVAGLLVVLATGMGLRLNTPAERTARRRIAVTALGCASAAALVATKGDLTSSAGLALGLLVCTTSVTHSLVLDHVRDHRVNVAISLSMLVLAAGLAPGFGIAVPLLATWALAVTAFVIAASDGEGAGARYDALPAPGPSSAASAGGTTRAATVLPAVSVAVLVGLAIALVLPHPSGLSARSALGPAAGSPDPTSTSGGRDAAAYLGGGPLDLDARGTLSDRPVAVVTGADETLWRATVLETYDGRTWSNNDTGLGTVLGASGNPTVVVPPDGRSPGQATSATRADAVAWLDASAPVVLSPGIVTAVGLRSQARVVQEGDGRLVLDSGGPTTTYAVRSAVVPPVSTVRTSTSSTADATAAVWRSLPPELPTRVGGLAAQITSGATTRSAKVQAIEEWLRANIRYDLDAPVPAQGVDSVDDLLFTSRRGFCEQFASAEVVMLRSLGIPARLVSGFAASGADSTAQSVLRASDAHAWVEVWLPGTGWASSDPTAGAALAAPHRDGLGGLLRGVADALTGSAVRKTLLAAALVLLAAAAVLVPGRLARRRRSRREHAPPSTPSPSGPLFAAFHRFETALAQTGRPRAPAESVRALAARLHATDDVVSALLAVERASYAGVPPTRDEVRAAADVIDREAARVLTAPATDPIAVSNVNPS